MVAATLLVRRVTSARVEGPRARARPRSPISGLASTPLGLRAALLPIALQAGGPPELVAAALGDRLHQPYRLAHMPQSAALYDALRAEGVPVVLAGAGPSLLALVDVDADDFVARIRQVCERQRAGWQVWVSAWDMTGAALL